MYYFSKWCWGNGMSMCTKARLDLCHIIYSNLKWIIELNVRSKISEFLKENFKGDVFMTLG